MYVQPSNGWEILKCTLLLPASLLKVYLKLSALKYHFSQDLPLFFYSKRFFSVLTSTETKGREAANSREALPVAGAKLPTVYWI